jgi:hypothetical protein
MKDKPRIAIYYSSRFGRNDGPPLFYYHRMQEIFGAKNVMHLDPTMPDIDKWGAFDYHFWVDWGEDAVLGREEALKLSIPDDGGKTIYVVSDAHLDDGYRFEKAKQFDYVFWNQMHYADEWVWVGDPMKEKIPKGYYLPHAAEPKAYPHFEIVKKYDVCFIGHIQEYHKGNGINMSRIDVLDAIFKAFPNFYYGTRNPAFPDKNMFEDAARHFCESKVVFNISIGNDANMRFFETLMTGSFLLTNDIPELKNLEQYGFKKGVHYDTYSTLEEAKELIKYYIENDEEREMIAKVGYKQALKTGTYEARIKEVLSKVG